MINPFKKQAAPSWPPTDADYAKGGAYDQNTEEGKHAYEVAYFNNEPARHPNDPGAYMPTLLGFTWLPSSQYSNEGLVWAANEVDRWIHVGKGDGTMQMTLDNWAARRNEYVVELSKRGITWVAPSYSSDSKEIPTPPHDPSRGR